ncbi:glycosyltransferase [Hyphomicrobium facile]|uniref:Hopene-associated glycosyltransferase HpnB n=1 Tax=Hyphomicrobium facile TaxID=51670 RepID=A0A1I7NKY1_9HYPH|nr:glycosyltransferase [Hyphomicrobium facile]SFV35295.1 hopene-associated glycosyltransferase HpnB [Hyphomicrobium facile]
MTAVDLIAAIGLVAWIYLLLLNGGFWLTSEREEFERGKFSDPGTWPRVTAVIPARNEADMLPLSLTSLVAQDYPGEFSIVLVDDQSTDGTAEIARKIAASSTKEVTIIDGAPLPAAWTGKVWAMHQGIAAATSSKAPDYLLLTDADIGYAPEMLRSLVTSSRANGRAMTSVMAKLKCESWAERALVPAFIFFFQMLYPFRWVNSKTAATAAAAGGCMLVERAALERAGGIAAIRGALIDDCALGKLLKKQGPIWLGLSNGVISLRVYPAFDDIRRMVARSAYAQLYYSPALLLGTVVGMGLIYLAPLAFAMFSNYPANAIAAATYALMVIAFQPTLRFYNRSPLWGLALPVIATAYVGFTLDSAYQHMRGRGGLWKGRVQAEVGRQ